MSNNSKTVVSAVVLVVLILGGLYWLKTHPGFFKRTPEVSKDNVLITKIDLTEATSTARVPKNLPSGLPIETAIVTESYTQDYYDRGVKLTGYTYTTTKSPKEVTALYKAYMNTNGYQILVEKVEDAKPSIIQGTKGRVELMVVSSVEGDHTNVQLTFTEKK